MKFQIKAVESRENYIAISKDTYDHENVYTMLVGRNASGKSRLLGKIANHYVFQKNDPYESVFSTSDSAVAPRQIIVISNSRYDKFPDPIRSVNDKNRSFVPYHYLASGSDRFFNPYKTLTTAFGEIFNFRSGSSRKENDLFRILDYIGFLPSCSFEIRRVTHTMSANDRRPSERLLFTQEEFDFSLRPSLEYLDSLMRGSRSISIRLDDYSGWQADASLNELSAHLPGLMKAGLVRVSRLTLYDKRSKDKVLFHQASSGQQCMLLLFLGLSGVMEDDSLVCIDEPEISLHPKWQAEFIGLLQETFAHYRGCHFLIATHSPQIVSGLLSENGFVADLERSELLRSSDYAKKSADFQLSEIFHEPGYKNEYLIRTLLVILSKISKNEGLSLQDEERVQNVESLRHRLDEADPVLHLLDQIKMLVF